MISISEELVRWFSILLASFIFSISLETDSLSSVNYLLINQGLFVTLAGYLLLTIPKSPGKLLTNISATVLMFIISTQLTIVEFVPLPILFRICLIILCLSLSLWSISQLSEALSPTLFHNSSHIRIPVLLFTAIITCAPVWLGPWVDLYLPDNSIINAIISLTPVTHFSVAAEYDFLRSEWFYRNTPFGSLPFSYPELNSIIISYLVFNIFLQTILWKLTGKKTLNTLNNNQPETKEQKLTIS